MPNLMPTDIKNEVETVLRNTAQGNQNQANFLTAYQILDRLPPLIRDRLIRERTIGGGNIGVNYAAPSVVSDAAEMIAGITIDYLDNRNMKIFVAGQELIPSAEVCGIYRLR